MVRVELGRCWYVVNWLGQAIKGRKRVGGYEPRKPGLIGTLTEFNCPVVGVSPVAALAEEQRYWIVGVFWGVLSLAANTPKPGWLLTVCDGRVVPLSDAQLAERLRLSRRAWGEAFGALQQAGAVDCTIAAIDVETQDEARRYEASRQMALPFDAGVLRGAPQAVLVGDDGLADEEPTAGRGAADPSPAGSGNSRCNDGPGIGPAARPGRDATRAPDGPVRDKAQEQFDLDVTRSRLAEAWMNGNPIAVTLFGEVFARALALYRDKVPKSKDRRDWANWAGACLRFSEPVNRLNCGRAFVAKWIELCATPDVANPQAVMVSWIKKGRTTCES